MTKKFDFDFSIPQGSKIVNFSDEDIKKKRNFKGAWTGKNKGAYGPANAPMVANGGSMVSTLGYGTPADPVSFPAGGIGESRNEKFLKFLESLSSETNSKLIDVVKNGFTACLEAK